MTTLAEAISEHNALSAALKQLDKRLVTFLRSQTGDQTALCVIDGDVFGVITDMHNHSRFFCSRDPEEFDTDHYPVLDGELQVP